MQKLLLRTSDRLMWQRKNSAKAICIMEQEGFIRRPGDIRLLFVYLFVLLLVFSSQGVGKVGYGIHVTVNDSNASTSWEKSHSTTVIEFNSVSSCKGTGNSSKYIKIDGLAGVGLLENTHTNMGRLQEERLLTAGSAVNYILIDENVSNNSNMYSVIINESMPSYLLSIEDIMYRGDGIHKRNSYTNNNDKIMTGFQAKRFSESLAYVARYRNALIMADVTPTKIVEFNGENYSSTIQMESSSDIYSGFEFRSSDEFIEEDYIGSFNLAKRISKEHVFQKRDYEDLDSLPALCSDEYADLDHSLQAARFFLCRSALNNSNMNLTDGED